MQSKLTLLLCILAFYGQSQNKAINHQVNAATGYYHAVFKDDLFSPLHYYTHSYAVNIGYRQIRNDHEFYGQINTSISKLRTNTASYLATSRYYANIELGYLKALKPFSDRWQMALGGQLHSYIDVINFNGLSAISFFGNHTIDIATKLKYKLAEKHQFTLQLNLPIAGILVRPPYSGWNNEVYTNNLVKTLYNGQFGSQNQALSFSSIGEYHYQFNDKWTGLAQYRLQYNQTQLNQTAINLNQHFLIGASLSF